MSHSALHTPDPAPLRVDKWLWAARFYKTRRLATEALQAGHVRVNGERCKPSKCLKPGDLVSVEKNAQRFDIEVLALSGIRGSAEIAHTLYLETAESITRREEASTLARIAHGGRTAPAQKPDKRERRMIRSFLERNS